MHVKIKQMNNPKGIMQLKNERPHPTLPTQISVFHSDYLGISPLTDVIKSFSVFCHRHAILPVTATC